MNSERPHPLLAQIPLTVSPFISLPTATTLPYTYKPLPSSLPPSSTFDRNTNTERDEKYIVSASGHAASPEDIIASCQKIQEHIRKVQEDAERTLEAWETDLKEKDLAEKRRVAPGWLDRDEKILEPERGIAGSGTMEAGMGEQEEVQSMGHPSNQKSAAEIAREAEGEQLDRAFGGMGLGK